MTLPENETILFGILLGFCTLVILGSVLFFSLVERALIDRTRIYDVPLREGQRLHEITGNVLFVAIFASGLALVFGGGRIETAPFSLTGAALTFVGTLITFDLYYFALHAAMHTKIGAPFHRWHHASRVNTPWTSFSMSPAESVGWVVGIVLWPMLTAGHIPFVLEGYVAWLVFFLFSNVLGHVNVEFVPTFVSSTAMGKILSHGVTYHALHHSRYQKHLCFFVNGLDTMFGQVWDDYPELHRRVNEGRPLTHLGERGDSAQPG